MLIKYETKLSPLSIIISDWVEAKCKFLGKPGKLPSSIILVDMIIESDNLTWPLSQVKYGDRYANNITKIEFNEDWSGKSIEYEGKRYKTYRDHLHFGSDYSDILTFTDIYDHLLSAPMHTQLELFSQFKPDPTTFYKKASLLLQDLNMV